MKKVLTLAWIVLGCLIMARLGLFAWRMTFGYGDVIHINLFVVLALLLLGLTWAYGRARIGKRHND
ncbi:MAG: hypothetical protein PSY12_02490 [bacterium]|nr:hypothetical protein [bacterium]